MQIIALSNIENNIKTHNPDGELLIGKVTDCEKVIDRKAISHKQEQIEFL